jgi:hypothetical protein
MANYPIRATQSIHFEDFSGAQFERLVFAYHVRVGKWKSVEWYGQVGSDLGRDIWASDGAGHNICIQCANRKPLTFAKVEADIKKVVTAYKGIPDVFRLVAGWKISANMRDKIQESAKANGIKDCDIWSGAEFEEYLRRDCEPLLKRFVEGVIFPDSPADIQVFAMADNSLSDTETLALMAILFDRPAFYTPISEESGLLDFKQAITDTIQALGTGIYKARDGQVIAHIPSRHQLKEPNISKQIQEVEKALAKLRAKFDEAVRSGAIKPCGCNRPDCPIYFMTSQVADDLERLRHNAMRLFQEAYPAFQMPRTWKRKPLI